MIPSKSISVPALGFLALLGIPQAAALAGEADPAELLLVESSAVETAVETFETLAIETVQTLPLVLTDTPRTDAVNQALRDKEALELAIAQLEMSQGAYGAELSEAYFQLGTTERALEHYKEAAQAFGAALQILRTGYGLFDMRQLPILEELVATTEALRDWQEVDSLRHLVHFITSRNPQADTEVRFQALLQLGHWKLRADEEELLPEKAESMKKALQLYENEIGKLEAGAPYNGKSMHMAALYLDLAEIQFSQAAAKYEMPITEFEMAGQPSVSTMSCIAFTSRDGRQQQVCQQVEVPNISYYLDPSNKKNVEIRHHLDEMQEAVLQAYYELQDAPEGTARRVELLAEVQRLTKVYNDFVTMNSKSSMYRLD